MSSAYVSIFSTNRIIYQKRTTWLSVFRDYCAKMHVEFLNTAGLEKDQDTSVSCVSVPWPGGPDPN